MIPLSLLWRIYLTGLPLYVVIFVWSLFVGDPPLERDDWPFAVLAVLIATTFWPLMWLYLCLYKTWRILRELR